MVNPLVNKALKTSKDPQHHEPVQPVPEHYAGDNNPYRGIEPHGVKPTFRPGDPEMEYDNGEASRLAHYVEAEPEPEPIPVRIVSDKGSVTAMRSFRVQLPQDGTPVRILGEMRERKNAMIHAGPNFGTDFAIASDPAQLANFGWNAYIHSNNAGTLSLTTQGDVWACATKLDPAQLPVTAPVELHILVEYWIDEQ